MTDVRRYDIGGRLLTDHATDGPVPRTDSAREDLLAQAKAIAPRVNFDGMTDRRQIMLVALKEHDPDLRLDHERSDAYIYGRFVGAFELRQDRHRSDQPPSGSAAGEDHPPKQDDRSDGRRRQDAREAATSRLHDLWKHPGDLSKRHPDDVNHAQPGDSPSREDARERLHAAWRAPGDTSKRRRVETHSLPRDLRADEDDGEKGWRSRARHRLHNLWRQPGNASKRGGR